VEKGNKITVSRGSIRPELSPSRLRTEEEEGGVVPWVPCLSERKRRGPAVVQRTEEGGGRTLAARWAAFRTGVSRRRGCWAAGEWGGTGPSELGSGLVPRSCLPFFFLFSFFQFFFQRSF